jgi:tetratricopeptide (TPR) repeat protein
VYPILNDLAALYSEQEKYIEAELLYLRALAICEQELGATDPHTAIILTKLASLYSVQEKYAEAEPLYHCAHVAEKTLSQG